MAPRPLVRNHRHPHHAGGYEYPPALLVPLEPVAYRLAQFSCPCPLFTVLVPVRDVISIALECRQHLLVAVGKPHTFDYQVLAVLPRQAVRHSQPQGQCAVVGNGGHAELATRRLIPAAQHEELIAAGIPPVLEPLLMAGVAVIRKVALLPPKPLRPEAQPYPARRDVGFQCRQPVPQIGQPPFLLMNLIQPAIVGGIGNLTLGPSHPPLQVVQPQFLLLPDRSNLAFQRHPHRVEHPGRDPVPLSGTLPSATPLNCPSRRQQTTSAAPDRTTLRRRTAPRRPQHVPRLRSRKPASDMCQGDASTLLRRRQCSFRTPPGRTPTVEPSAQRGHHLSYISH